MKRSGNFFSWLLKTTGKGISVRRRLQVLKILTAISLACRATIGEWGARFDAAKQEAHFGTCHTTTTTNVLGLGCQLSLFSLPASQPSNKSISGVRVGSGGSDVAADKIQPTKTSCLAFQRASSNLLTRAKIPSRLSQPAEKRLLEDGVVACTERGMMAWGMASQ